MRHLNTFQECSAALSVALSGVEPGHKALFDGGCQQQMATFRNGGHAACCCLFCLSAHGGSALSIHNLVRHIIYPTASLYLLCCY